MERLNSAFDQGTQRVLQIIPSSQQSYQVLARVLKSRISQSISPSVSVVIVNSYLSEATATTPFNDLQNTTVIETVFYKKDLKPILEDNAQSTVLIVSASQSSDVFAQLQRHFEKNPTFSVEGIYIDQKATVGSGFSQERLDQVLQTSDAILYGVASGSPGGLRRVFSSYEKAFAMGELIDFSQITMAYTNWLSYEDAQKIVMAAGIRSKNNYIKWEKPSGIPVSPWRTYRNHGWTTFKDFLGIRSSDATQESNHQMLTLEEAKEVVRKQQFWIPKQYTYWTERPANLPINPVQAYAKRGWKGWEDFFGLSKWMTYEEAQKAVAAAGVDNWQSFNNWSGRPHRLPPYPDRIYKEWTSAADFFKNPKIKKGPTTIQILPYPEAEGVASKWAQENRITKLTTREYEARKDRPMGLPLEPSRYYKGKGWVDMDTFLGLKKHSPIKLLNATSESQSPDQWAAQ